MLKFVFGRSGYGKTEYIFNEIKRLVDNGVEDILLFTPEQYSFISERKLLDMLGEANVSKVRNLSFSRFASRISSEFGKNTLPVLSTGGKTILMAQAINACRDELKLFNKKLDTSLFVSSMIKLYDEMKSCNLDADQIISLSENIEGEVLRFKLNDVAVVMKCYEQMISDKFLDASDSLTRLYKTLADKEYFKGKHVFFDGFNGFVAQEYKIFELIIKECEKVTVSLCSDSFEKNDPYSLFSYVNKSANILKEIAVKANVTVDTKNLDTNYRANNDELATIEKIAFSSNAATTNSNGNVSIYSATSITDECENVSRKIKVLLRQGVLAKDIVVITRSLPTYKSEIEAAFKKFEVPYFNDERQPIKTQPLVVFIEYLFRIINYSFRSDDIISLAKTGLIDITEDELNELESYIFVWNINGLRWTSPFENSPRGLVDKISERDKEALERINKTRETIIEPLLIFKNACKSKDATKICESIYYTLLSYKSNEIIRKRAIELNELGMPLLSEQLGKVWDLVMELLNQIAISITEEISIKDLANLFSLMISAEDIGSLPSGIDNVQFGQADRIRTNNPKIVFVIGANEDQFPQKITSNGILSEAERQTMLKHNFKLYSYGEILGFQEKYFAYMALSAPTDKLFISYVNNGADIVPSRFIDDIKTSVNGITEETYFDNSNIDLIESRESAFNLLTEKYSINNEFLSSLKKYFENDDRQMTIEKLVNNENHYITDTSIATALFKYNMFISASKVEDFYTCPYKFYMRYGIKVTPQKKVEIGVTQRGTIIHKILEDILSEIGSKKLSTLTEREIKNLVDEYCKRYFDENMAYMSDLSKKLMFNFNRISSLIYNVVIRISNEFKTCDFVPSGFEVNIDIDGNVKPEVIPLEDNGTIQIKGSIDRVDTYSTTNKNYVRVVDYKTGSKEFALSDITGGLNLQMFIYLFSLCNDKTSALTGIPAGVLYMHASNENINITDRNSIDETIATQDDKIFKMRGIVLDDENNNTVLPAMESDMQGKFVPMEKEDTITLEQFDLLHKEVNGLIAGMGNSLHLGYVNQSPAKNIYHSDVCKYCDYKDICTNSRELIPREIEDKKNSEILSMLESKNNEQNGEKNETVD